MTLAIEVEFRWLSYEFVPKKRVYYSEIEAHKTRARYTQKDRRGTFPLINREFVKRGPADWRRLEYDVAAFLSVTCTIRKTNISLVALNTNINIAFQVGTTSLWGKLDVKSATNGRWMKILRDLACASH